MTAITATKIDGSTLYKHLYEIPRRSATANSLKNNLDFVQKSLDRKLTYLIIGDSFCKPGTPNNQFKMDGCLVISNHFLCKDLLHHPIDSQPFIQGNPSCPPKATPPRNKALLRVY